MQQLQRIEPSSKGVSDARNLALIANPPSLGGNANSLYAFVDVTPILLPVQS